MYLLISMQPFEVLSNQSLRHRFVQLWRTMTTYSRHFESPSSLVLWHLRVNDTSSRLKASYQSLVSHPKSTLSFKMSKDTSLKTVWFGFIWSKMQVMGLNSQDLLHSLTKFDHTSACSKSDLEGISSNHKCPLVWWHLRLWLVYSHDGHHLWCNLAISGRIYQFRRTIL